MKKPSQEEIDQYRREWFDLTKNNPGLSAGALHDKYGYRLHNWLSRYDSEWFASHRPRYKKCKLRPRVNWRERDIDMAKAVAAAKLNKNLPGTPLRITAALIARNIEGRSRLRNLLHKLRQTRETLKKVVETRSDFTERRLRWVLKMCQEENVPPSSAELRSRTNFRQRAWNLLLTKAKTD